MKTGAIIPAGGLGQRMGGKTPKQFLHLGGKPLLEHTLAAFQESDTVQSAVLVVPEQELAHARQWVGNPPVVQQVVCGGPQRQDSVRNGFNALDPDTEIVVVHDGVRPFVTPDLIRRTVAAACETGAAITAVPVNDTLKKSDPRGCVDRTVSRENLWRVQTPQAFRYDLLKSAFELAEAESFYGTDEGSLIERLGQPVRIISGSELNIKITRAEDLVLGEAIAAALAGRMAGEA